MKNFALDRCRRLKKSEGSRLTFRKANEQELFVSGFVIKIVPK